MWKPQFVLLAAVPFLLTHALAAEGAAGASQQPDSKLTEISLTKSGAKKKKKSRKRQQDGLRFELKKHPTLRAGDWLRLDLRLKVQTDMREFSDPAEQVGLLDPRRFRAGVQGRLFNDLEFEVEYELLPKDHQLRDAFVNYRRFRTARLQAGKFKIPFGMDQLTGPTNLDFVYRSRIGSQLTPGRDHGLMLHGELFESGLRYQAGVFQHDGEIAEAKGNIPTGGRTAAARIVAAPLHFVPGTPVLLRNLEIGAAMTHSDIAEGQFGLRGRTVAGDTYFDRMYVKGARVRQGLEADWRIGALALKGEYINVRQQRLEQSLRVTDLPDLVARGWYVSAVHPLFGSRKGQNQQDLLHSFLPGTSLGLVEAAVRWEQIRFGSRAASSTAVASRSLRAANVLGNSDRGLTLGINWEATRFTRFQFNAIREALEDTVRFPVSGTRRYWTYTGRIQFTL